MVGLSWRRIQAEIAAIGPKLVLAVSGGRDSMFLMDFVSRMPDRPKLDIIVAHYNHCDHEKSSEHAEFVSKQAMHFGFDCVVENRRQDIRNGNVEFQLRSLRMAFLMSFEDRVVVTGHHANDQIENILIRILNGWPHSQLAMPRHGKTFKPFLDVPREKIDKHVQRHNIPYIEDPTNDNRAFDRNWIRHEVIPSLVHRKNINQVRRGIGK